MIPSTAIALAGVLACLIGQAFFSGSEIAMVSANRLSLRTRADQGQPGAHLALALLAREDRLLGTCLIGTNLALVTGTTLVAMVLGWWHVPLGLAAALAYTPIALIFGETLSKTVFQFHADRLAPTIAYPLRAFQLIFAPALVLVGLWSKGLDMALGRGVRDPVRREEIVDLLEGGDSNSIDADERRLIRRVFEISETHIEDVMTPLVDIEAVSVDATVAEASAVATTSGHSRLPIYRERIDNIVGVVHVQALLFAPSSSDPVEPLMEPAVFVPGSKRVDDLLTELRQRRDPLAVVVDEYGGSIGLVSIEDLLEEIVGEIRDERDEDEPAMQRLGEHVWRVPARTEVEEFLDETGYELPEGDYETVAGYVLSMVGRIPDTGEVLTLGPLIVRIEEANERAIIRLNITLPS